MSSTRISVCQYRSRTIVRESGAIASAKPPFDFIECIPAMCDRICNEVRACAEQPFTAMLQPPRLFLSGQRRQIFFRESDLVSRLLLEKQKHACFAALGDVGWCVADLHARCARR